MSERWVLCGEVHSLGCRPAQTRCSCLSRTNGNREQGVRHMSQADAERKKGHKPELLIIAASSLQQYQRHGVSVWHPCVFPVTAVGVERGKTSNPVSFSSQPENITVSSAAENGRTARSVPKLYLIKYRKWQSTLPQTQTFLKNICSYSYCTFKSDFLRFAYAAKNIFWANTRNVFLPWHKFTHKKIKLRQLSHHFESFASSKDVNKFKF